MFSIGSMEMSEEEREVIREFKVGDKIIKIREFAGSVGAQVWTSSLLLAEWIEEHKELFQGRQVMEIGCGCGLPGIVSAIYAEKTILTDYEEPLLDNVRRNIALNAEYFRNGDGESKAEGGILVEKLDWNDIPDAVSRGVHPVDILIGADITYTGMTGPMDLFEEAIDVKIEENSANVADAVRACLKNRQTEDLSQPFGIFFLRTDRGDDTDKFIETCRENGLICDVERFTPDIVATKAIGFDKEENLVVARVLMQWKE